MTPEEYQQYDATALADLIRRKEVSPRQVSEAAIARAQTVNGTLHAICQPQFESALATASNPMADAPFAGVPFLFKDLSQEQAGEPCTFGSRAFYNYRPAEDSEYVRRCRQAGLIPMGRTATPELGLKAITESRLWGASRNPWDRERTPGGSSGGSGAAVAAGIVPMAGANDGGGSIRIPAAYNGLFGLKPSRGRISGAPFASEPWTGAASDHVVSRTVRDSAAMLDVLAGAVSGDPFVIPPPEAPFARLMQQAPKRLRIGLFTQSPYGTEVDASCVEAVEKTGRLLSELGHEVEAAAPEFDGPGLARCYLGIYFGEVSALMARARNELGARASDFELDTRLLGLLGETLPVPEYVQLRQRWNEFGRALGRYFEGYDLYLSPTTGQPPARIGELETPGHLQLVARLMIALKAGRLVHKSGQVETLALESLSRTPFTQLANLTGTPAMSVPLHWSQSGLPVGVQFGAPHGQEGLLLQLAAQLEEASPWFQRYQQIA